jgi:hypothetical protein
MHRIPIATLALLSSSGLSAAVCIDGHPILGVEYASSRYVIEGKIIRIQRNVLRPFSYGGKSYSEPVDRLTVSVTSVFKGSPPRKVIFESPKTSAAFPARLGRRYLLFLRQNGDGQTLYVDTCGGSQLVADVKNETKRGLTRLARSRLNNTITESQ